jgi:Fe-S-cluster containining protein
MATILVAKCGIYEKRPEVCRKYPTIDHYIPPQCTYYFAGTERRGECSCGESACCAVPREGGEPGGAPIPEIAGGEPCKHIVYEEVFIKEAADDEVIDTQSDAYGDLEDALGQR